MQDEILRLIIEGKIKGKRSEGGQHLWLRDMRSQFSCTSIKKVVFKIRSAS